MYCWNAVFKMYSGGAIQLNWHDRKKEFSCWDLTGTFSIMNFSELRIVFNYATWKCFIAVSLVTVILLIMSHLN